MGETLTLYFNVKTIAHNLNLKIKSVGLFELQALCAFQLEGSLPLRTISRTALKLRENLVFVLLRLPNSENYSGKNSTNLKGFPLFLREVTLNIFEPQESLVMLEYLQDALYLRSYGTRPKYQISVFFL